MSGPEEYSRVYRVDGDRLPSTDVLVAHFKSVVETGADRDDGAVIVYVARVRAGKEPRVIVGGVTYGEIDYLTSLATSIKLHRQAGFLHDACLRQFAKLVREITNGRA